MELEDKLKDLIKRDGPLPIDKFMSMAVEHYYSNNNIFGIKGDFITAPEVSQMFGEVIGAWCASVWQSAGSPEFAIAELGPGRGTLMDDILRATKNVPNFQKKMASINLIETSNKLKLLQKEKLLGYAEKLSWHKDITALPEVFTIVIANEFFDALPVKQFKCEGGHVYERVVDFSEKGFEFAYISAGPQVRAEFKEGEILEISPTSEQYAIAISKHIKRYGGAAVISDYGYVEYAQGETLQALKAHKYHPVLKDIGQADITAHVNFKTLEKEFCKSGLKAQIQTQSEFLLENGIMLRATQLIKKAGRDKIKADLDRLLSPNQMGEIFKLLSVTE